MKKQWNRALAGAIMLAVLLTGCGGAASSAGGQQPQSQSAAASSAASAPAASSEPSPWNDTLIGEMLMAEGSGKDDMGTEFTYSYHVPEILDSSIDAKAINYDIDEFVAAGCRSMLDSIGEGSYPWVPSVDWTSHWNGSILSLVIEKETDYQGTIYHVYRYDFATGHAVRSSDLIGMLGITEEEYWETLRRTAVHEMDREMSSYPPGLEPDALMEMRAITLSHKNIHAAQPILMEDGTLQVVFDVQTPAGAGSQQLVLTPDFAPEPGPALQDEYDCITAALRDNELTLAWRGTPGAGDHMGKQTAIGEAYRVHGLYGNYVDMAVGNLTDDTFPYNHYVVLLDDLGGISFCNVTSCALSGDYYVLGGPLWIARDIVAVESAPAPGEGIYAVTKSGRKIDLREALAPTFMITPYSMQNTVWNNPDNAWSFECTDNEYSRSVRWFSMDGGEYSGSMDFTGMTGEGLVYQWLMLDWDNNLVGGILIQNCDPQNGYGSGGPTCLIRQYLGEPMQGLDENGEATVQVNWN